MKRPWLRRLALTVTGLVAALALATTGLYLHTERLLAVADPALALRWPALPPGDAAEGARLGQVVCGECHGVDLAGYPEDGTPGLQAVKAYSADAFDRLLREGTTKAGGDSASGLMSSVARYRFPALRDDEIRDLKRYLDQH